MVIPHRRTDGPHGEGLRSRPVTNPAPRTRRVPWPGPATLAVVAAAALHAVVYARLSLLRQEAFWNARFDVGNMVQAVWTTAHGDLLSTTNTQGEQVSRLAAHVDPLLALFAPLWWLWPSPDMLLVAQAVAVATGALPVFWLGRRWLADERLAVAAAFAYLLQPALGWATVTEFHPFTLAAPLVLFAVWAVVECHDVLLVLFCGAALISKEQVGLSLAVLGVWMALSLGRRRAGLLLSAVSLAWVAFAVQVVTPHYNRGSASVFVRGRYSDLGDSPGDVLKGLVLHPDRAVETLVREDRVTYLLALLLPLGAMALFAPLLAAGALPDLLLNMLSSRTEQHQVEYHYAAVIVPFLVLGAVRGLAALRARSGPAWLVALLRRPWPVALAVVLVAAAGAWRLGPLPVWSHVPGGSDWRNNEYEVTDHARVLARAVAMVPADGDVVVSATNHAGGHLSARHRIYSFPVVRDAEWVLVDRRRPEMVADDTERDLARAFVQLSARPDMRRVFAADGVYVFRRATRGQSTTTSTTSSASRATSSATGVAASSSVSSR